MMGEMSEPKITPLARRLAEENGIDWRRIEGTGPEGEITERDILNFLAKVMAGEITLEGPPPGEPPPPEGEADLESARKALEREGLTLEELIPQAPTETAEFELDLDLDEAEAEPTPPPPAEVTAWREETIVEEVTSEFPEVEEAPADVTAELPVFEEEAPAEPPPAPEPPPREPTAELPVFEEPAAPEPQPSTDITAELPVFEEEAPAEPPPAPEPPAKEPTAELPVFEEPAAATPPAAEAAPEPPVYTEERAAEAAPPAPVPIWYRPVDLGPLDALLAEFGTELGRALPRAALLYLAVKRALADLEVPLRPLKEGRKVPPSENLAGFLAAWETAEEPGEGLWVTEAEPPLALVAPALALATQGLPEGQGLLILAGELPTAEAKFLERVAHYLEKPIRLLLFG